LCLCLCLCCQLWERKVTFLGGATARESFLPEDLPEIAFIGPDRLALPALWATAAR
jgi:hypothetical protein